LFEIIAAESIEREEDVGINKKLHSVIRQRVLEAHPSNPQGA
jgi:hypothetical protein